MLKSKIKKFLDIMRARFKRKKYSNIININNMSDGKIYQDTTINTFFDPALSISHIKNNPDDIKITFGSIANVLIQPSNVLPEGYQPVVTIKNGKTEIHSEPLNDEAKRKYPQTIEMKFKTTLPKGIDFNEALTRARISQVPIDVEMLEIKKKIGDMVDPYQDEFQELMKKSTCKIMPEKLPLGKKCTVGIEGIPYKYKMVLDILPVNPDDDIVKLSNENYNDDFVLTLIYYKRTKQIKYNMYFTGRSWSSINKFSNFMKAAVPGKVLYVRVNESEIDLISVELVDFLYKNYNDVEKSIELSKRIIVIESYYGLQFPTDIDISSSDIDSIWLLSESIWNKPLNIKWNYFKCSISRELFSRFTEELRKDCSLKIKEVKDIEILKTKIANLTISTVFKFAKIESFKFVNKNKEEFVMLSFIPGAKGNNATIFVEI